MFGAAKKLHEMANLYLECVQHYLNGFGGVLWKKSVNKENLVGDPLWEMKING